MGNLDKAHNESEKEMCESLYTKYRLKNVKYAELILLFASGLRDSEINTFCKEAKVSKSNFYKYLRKINEHNDIDLMAIAKSNQMLNNELKSALRNIKRFRLSNIDILQMVGDKLLNNLIENLRNKGLSNDTI